MNIEKLTPDSITKFIPNLLTEVEGERSLFDKLVPYIDSAKRELEVRYLGVDDILSESHNEFALKILVAKALADAAPALDLVVTPTGMAVINTESLAPASKERVERLIASLREYVSVNLSLLIDICRTYEAWRNSKQGEYFCSTFLSSLSVVLQFPENNRPAYSWVHENAILVEKELEMDYIGSSVMNLLRDMHNSGKCDEFPEVISSIISVIKAALIAKLNCRPFPLWHHARQIIYGIQLNSELDSLWRADMDDKSTDTGFENNIKGAFFY